MVLTAITGYFLSPWFIFDLSCAVFYWASNSFRLLPISSSNFYSKIVFSPRGNFSRIAGYTPLPLIVMGSGSLYPTETKMTSLKSVGSTGEIRTTKRYFSPPAMRPCMGDTSTNPFFLTNWSDTLNSKVTLPVLSMKNSRETHSQKRTSPNSMIIGVSWTWSVRLTVEIIDRIKEESPTNVTSYSGPPTTWQMAYVLNR